MKKSRSLAVVNEDNFITKIINSLKNILKFKQQSKEVKKDNLNRRAMVIKTEKIEKNVKRNITYAELVQMENSISKNINIIDGLDEDELNVLDNYYDARINELNATLNDKKSKYFKIASQRRA